MSAAGRYIPRSPRYILTMEDQSLMRFAAMETRGVAAQARVRDVSDTGLAFTLPDTETSPHPDEGDMIKIEFTVPGRKQIACFATVVRVERRVEWEPEWGEQGHLIIALKFRHLPKGHLEAIRLGLSGRVRPEDDNAGNGFVIERHPHLGAFCGSTLALVLALALMTLPPRTWLAPFAWALGLNVQ